MRRTDFLPVGPGRPDEVLERGYHSESSGEDGVRGMEYAFGCGSDSDAASGEASDGAGGMEYACGGGGSSDAASDGAASGEDRGGIPADFL